MSIEDMSKNNQTTAPLPRKPTSSLHHPLGFELYDGIKMDLYALEYAESALAVERQRVAWVSVDDRLPGITEPCDWLYPRTNIKSERWILTGECRATAPVPGEATHWRPAGGLPDFA